ncbi:MAG: methyl-accepting chemotaxis protein [Hungatella sp.]
MKTIKSRIILVLLSFIVLCCLILGIMGSYLNYSTANDVLEQNLIETAVVSGAQVAAEIKAIQNVAIETGSIARIANPDTPIEQKQEIIQQRAKSHDFQRGNLLNAQGISLFDGNDYSERDYFKTSMQGKTYISDPTISKITGKLTFLVSAPVWEGGIPDTKVIGVIYYAPNETFLNDIVSSITVSDSGYAYMINRKGTSVADPDASLVSVENSIQEAQTDKSMAALADIETKMIAGETGFATYKYHGSKWVQGYAPVANTDGWSIGVVAMEKDFLGNFYLSIWITLIVVAVFITAGILCSIKFGNQIGNPISACVERLKLLSTGDLKSPVPVVHSKDETGVLADATALLTKSLNNVVNEVSETLVQMANNNFTVSELRAYQGDFLPLSQSTNHIVESLNDTLSQINVASDQVSVGSDQVSSGAQALSQGATEQASSIEELSASILEVSANVKQNAGNANNANILSSEAAAKLMEGNQEMGKMLAAMTDISDSSKKISNIIKTINDIAFQTNILALNAAVEAARAGEAGKGFAVVAEEVRNLASKSAAASKDTTALIESSIRAVDHGTQLADNTASLLQEVMDKATKSTNLVSAIANASGEQSQSLEQVTLGIEQISAVVQTNSATAEESAAASEELSGQATMLKQLVSQFKLKDPSSNRD